MKSDIGARPAALEVLHALGQDGATPLPVLLRREAEKDLLDSRDAALAAEMVRGVLVHAKELDAALLPFLRNSSKLSARMRMLLRLGAFELRYLEAIPPRATVHELAGLARRRFGPRMGGLANAVLRALAQKLEGMGKEALSSHSPETLAERYSLPLWLVRMWERQYGAEDAASYVARTLESPVPCWRVNWLKPEAEGLLKEWMERGAEKAGKHGFFLPDGLLKKHAREERNGGENFLSDSVEMLRLDAEGRQSLPDAWERLLLEEQQGLLSRQGISSQMVAEKIAEWIGRQGPAFRTAPLWDACCGRGGKTAVLLENGIAVSAASDPSARRLEDLEASLRRLGLPLPEIRCCAAQEMQGSFPLILLDAPCSGTGTLARNPELRLRLSPEKLEQAVRLQAELLDCAWERLSAGGTLFYATCAVNKEENEGQIARFCGRHAKEARLALQERCWPSLRGADGLFLAILQKGPFTA